MTRQKRSKVVECGFFAQLKTMAKSTTFKSSEHHFGS